MQSGLSPAAILGLIAFYFVILIVISRLTAGKGDNKTFFTANRTSPWYLVAFGMIGASLSGVTFISIPGAVGGGGANQQFAYMQIVFGYLFGYIVIAYVLLPIYYQLKLTSIYSYLNNRFGHTSQLTGSVFFLISRVIGAAFRLYLVAIILDIFVMRPLGISFGMTVFFTIVLIWIYTYKGGIKTIVITDTLQTACMLAVMIMTIVSLADRMDMSLLEVPGFVSDSVYGQLIHLEGGWSDPNNFFKQFIAGMFITIVMTGLDQDMMQKNLTCRSLRDAQKNMISLGAVLIPVNFLVLTLGAMLFLFAEQQGIVLPDKGDHVFPTVALQFLSPAIGILFVIGLIAAAYSSADSALTSLTTSFCVDILGFESPDNKKSEQEKKRTRLAVHIAFSFILFLVIIVFRQINDDSVINELFRVAGYTYGPLLGLFVFGLFTRRQIRDRWVFVVCLLSPVLTYLFNANSERLLGGYKFGFELLLLNGIITLLGLMLISKDAR